MDTAVRLCGPVALASAATTQYTVPAGTQTIVRSIHVVNTGSVDEAVFTLSLGTDAEATQLWHTPIPAGNALDWSGFLVMSSGEILEAAALTGVLTLTVSGIEVTA